MKIYQVRASKFTNTSKSKTLATTLKKNVSDQEISAMRTTRPTKHDQIHDSSIIFGNGTFSV